MSRITEPACRRRHPGRLLVIVLSTLMVAVVLVVLDRAAIVPREIPKVGATTITVLAGAFALLAGVAFVLVTRRGRITHPA